MASLGGKAGIDAAGVALAGPCASIGRVQCRIETGPGKAPCSVAVVDRAAVQGDRGQGLSPVRNPSRRIDRESFFMGAASHHAQVRAGTLLALAKMVDAKLAFAPVPFATWTVAWNVKNKIAVRVRMARGHHIKSVQNSLSFPMSLSVNLQSVLSRLLFASCQVPWQGYPSRRPRKIRNKLWTLRPPINSRSTFSLFSTGNTLLDILTDQCKPGRLDIL